MSFMFCFLFFLLRSINEKTPVIPGFNNETTSHIKKKPFQKEQNKYSPSKHTPTCVLTALGRCLLGEK